MNKVTRITIGAICIIGILGIIKFNNFKLFADSFKSKDLSNQTPYIEKSPDNYKKGDEKMPAPLDLTKFNGSAQEVKDFIQKSLKDSVVIPPKLKSDYAHASVGNPKFVKNLNSKNLPDQRVDDYYIVPLMENNQLIGACTVSIYDGQLTLGSLSSYGVIKYSVFNNDIPSILSNVEKDNKVKIIDYKLVYKKDASSKLCLNKLDPMLELTSSDGKKFYYSNRGKVIDNDTFNSLEKSIGNGLFSN